MTGTGECDMQYLLTVQSVSFILAYKDPAHDQVNAYENAPRNTPHACAERRADAPKQILLPSCTDDERVRPIKRDHTFDCVRNLARDEFDHDGKLAPAIFEVAILLLDEPH